MNKSELVAAVAAEAGLTKVQAQKAVEAKRLPNMEIRCSNIMQPKNVR